MSAASDPDAAFRRLDFEGYSVGLEAFEAKDGLLGWVAYLVACEAARPCASAEDRVDGCYQTATKVLVAFGDRGPWKEREVPGDVRP